MVVGYDAKDLELKHNLKKTISKSSLVEIKGQSSSDDETDDNGSTSSSTDVDDDDGGAGQIVSAQYEGRTTTTVVEAKHSVVHVGDKTIVINKLSVPKDCTASNGIVGFLESIDCDNPPQQDKFEEEQKKVTFIGGVVLKTMAIAVTLTLVLVAFIVILQLMQINSQNVPQDSPDDDGDDQRNVSVVTRGNCKLLKPTVEIPKLRYIPPKIVVIAHTATDPCSSWTGCCETVRNIQAYHFTMDYGDISYQYLIGGDGRAYEGRQWNAVGAHSYGYNCLSLGIAFIGNFLVKLASEKQIFAALNLLDLLVQKGRLDANYTVYCQNQLIATSSPGAGIIGQVHKWKRWANFEGPPEPYGAGYNGTSVKRSQCHLPSPTLPIRNMTTIPPTVVVISHTDTKECFTLPFCCTMVENSLTYQTSKQGFTDIGYHFLVGGDGRIYEGRKWYSEGAHTKGWNCMALGISFIGDFAQQVPTDKQVSGCVNFLKTLVEIGQLDVNYTLYYHKQLSKTESPGAELIDIVKTWDHWSANITRQHCN